MTGVTLRYTWIPWAMFVSPGPEPVLPSGGQQQADLVTASSGAYKNSGGKPIAASLLLSSRRSSKKDADPPGLFRQFAEQLNKKGQGHSNEGPDSPENIPPEKNGDEHYCCGKFQSPPCETGEQ